jgi:ferrous iron transport protein B
MNTMRNLILVGNPNSGKTKFFNLLTKDSQTTGNWSGVTVDKKQGVFTTKNHTFNVVDLPGIYTLGNKIPSLDEKVALDFITQHPHDIYLNIIDGSNIERAIYLTTQLREQGVQMIVLLNMMDIVRKKGIQIDTSKLREVLQCEVIPMSLKEGFDTNLLVDAVNHYQPVSDWSLDYPQQEHIASDNEHKLKAAKALIEPIIIKKSFTTTLSDNIDTIVVGKVTGMMVFFAVMYMLFLFSINIGGAFIDFFDIVAGAIFIDGVREVLQSIHTPALIIAVFEGIGSGIQVVATFVPVIGALYLFLTLLEESGYMARAAFVMDKLMRNIGLSGKAFVPLIIGFGCNVPGIMATRTLDNKQERLSTIMMSPFMSCGARLAVYALFAAAFFPTSGANIVFLLYLIGILIAIATGFILKKGFKNTEENFLIMEMPLYQAPSITTLFTNTWNKLKGFILGAGKIIVIVVTFLSIIDNIGTDGSFNNQNSEQSVLSASAKTLTPVFAPMGVKEENWEAVVGIITGVLAKEVVVGTLDSLYTTKAPTNEEFILLDEVDSAFTSIVDNISMLMGSLFDPLGLSIVSDTDSLEVAADTQEVSVSTFSIMQEKFDGKIGAFAYLLFILLYFPCVAALGAMMREAGTKWGIIGALWSTTLAYTLATIFYQVATFTLHPVSSSIWIGSMISILVICIILLNNTARNTTVVKIINI